VSIETVNIQIPVKQWQLHPIELEPVIYPATVPRTDPRYDAYIAKRALILYPPGETNNSD